jgi:hypothetical protein
MKQVLMKLEEENSTYKRVISKMEIQMKQLKAENDVLKKNISCLFKTAKEELERKDSEIDSLKK